MPSAMVRREPSTGSRGADGRASSITPHGATVGEFMGIIGAIVVGTIVPLFVVQKLRGGGSTPG
jgi:hypothetical protein